MRIRKSLFTRHLCLRIKSLHLKMYYMCMKIQQQKLLICMMIGVTNMPQLTQTNYTCTHAKVCHFKCQECWLHHHSSSPNLLLDWEVIGIEHTIVIQILDFKQKDNEMARECMDRLHKYIARCLAKEGPSQENLKSCFVEGIKGWKICIHLFGIAT